MTGGFPHDYRFVRLKKISRPVGGAQKGVRPSRAQQHKNETVSHPLKKSPVRNQSIGANVKRDYPINYGAFTECCAARRSLAVSNAAQSPDLVIRPIGQSRFSRDTTGRLPTSLAANRFRIVNKSSSGNATWLSCDIISFTWIVCRFSSATR